MNKARVNSLLPFAYDAIRESGIPSGDGSVQKSFRSQISTFGAAVTMGSLTAAVAFFSDRGGAAVDRSKLPEAIFRVLKKDGAIPDGCERLFDWVRAEAGRGNEVECRDAVLHAAVAIKLAMNLYPLSGQE